MLHALGRESDKVGLIGSWSGTLAVITRQAQSMLVLISDFNESQQFWVGVVTPFEVLPVMKLRHGVKLEIIDVVHGVVIWPFTEMTERVANNNAKRWKVFNPSIMFWEKWAHCRLSSMEESLRFFYRLGFGLRMDLYVHTFQEIWREKKTGRFEVGSGVHLLLTNVWLKEYFLLINFLSLWGQVFSLGTVGMLVTFSSWFVIFSFQV